MDSEADIQPPLTLPGFCQVVIRKHASAWPPGEASLADEFLSFFQVEGFMSFLRFAPEELCSRLGIRVTVRDLPQDLRGHNCAYQGKREIVIGVVNGPAKTLGSQEHTLFHELREQIEHEFKKLGHPTAVGPQLEQRAESFASLVRSLAAMKLWKPVYQDFAEKSGAEKLGLILLGCALLFTLFTYFMLPYWEDRWPNFAQQKQTQAPQLSLPRTVPR